MSLWVLRGCVPRESQLWSTCRSLRCGHVVHRLYFSTEVQNECLWQAAACHHNEVHRCILATTGVGLAMDWICSRTAGCLAQLCCGSHPVFDVWPDCGGRSSWATTDGQHSREPSFRWQDDERSCPVFICWGGWQHTAASAWRLAKLWPHCMMTDWHSCSSCKPLSSSCALQSEKPYDIGTRQCDCAVRATAIWAPAPFASAAVDGKTTGPV